MNFKLVDLVWIARSERGNCSLMLLAECKDLFSWTNHVGTHNMISTWSCLTLDYHKITRRKSNYILSLDHELQLFKAAFVFLDTDFVVPNTLSCSKQISLLFQPLNIGLERVPTNSTWSAACPICWCLLLNVCIWLFSANSNFAELCKLCRTLQTW